MGTSQGLGEVHGRAAPDARSMRRGVQEEKAEEEVQKQEEEERARLLRSAHMDSGR